MAKQVKSRGGTSVQTAAFTGADREITVDTTLYTAVVHDGVTAGGHPLSLAPSEQLLTGYTIAGSPALPAATDTINEGFGKLAKIASDVPTVAESKLAGFPVNSIKLTTDNVNPGTLIGGTWSAMTTPSATLFGETVYGWKRTA